jgi:hypothetical protein
VARCEEKQEACLLEAHIPNELTRSDIQWKPQSEHIQSPPHQRNHHVSDPQPLTPMNDALSIGFLLISQFWIGATGKDLSSEDYARGGTPSTSGGS